MAYATPSRLCVPLSSRCSDAGRAAATARLRDADGQSVCAMLGHPNGNCHLVSKRTDRLYRPDDEETGPYERFR